MLVSEPSHLQSNEIESHRKERLSDHSESYLVLEAKRGDQAALENFANDTYRKFFG